MNRSEASSPHASSGRPEYQHELELVAAPRPSFHDFYLAHRDRIGRALALTIGDADLAADSVDEALTRAFVHWDKVGTMDNAAGWVYRVALNVARSRIRRIRRRPTRPPDGVGHGVASYPAGTGISDPSIVRALRALPVDQRSVVVCRLLLGWSEAETAAALRIRPGTAKSRLHRAVNSLESTLSHLRSEDQR